MLQTIMYRTTLQRSSREGQNYTDDIGCFSDNWQKHVLLLNQVCSRLQDNEFTVDSIKCEWEVQEIDWLGYWLTPVGLKPLKKKIRVVMKIEPPKNVKQLRGFIGADNYYRDIRPKGAYVLAPLTDAVDRYGGNRRP